MSSESGQQDVESKPKSARSTSAGHEYEDVLQIIGNANVLEAL